MPGAKQGPDDRAHAWDGPVTPAWLEQRERGSVFAIRLLVGAAGLLGRPAARVLLYPVCGYFLVFSPRARAASRQYLARAM